MSAVRPSRAATWLVGLAGVVAGVVALDAWGPRLPGVEEAATQLAAWPAVIVVALITVTGETVVLAAVMVALQGEWSLIEVLAWCFVGTVVSDAVWFRLAGAIDERWLQHREIGPGQQRLLTWLRERTGARPYLALLFIKFLYGSRLLMTVYLATRRIPLSTFLVYNAAGTAVWLAVLTGVGWLLHHGLMGIAGADRLDLLVLAVIVLLVSLRGGSAWIARARRQSVPS